MNLHWIPMPCLDLKMPSYTQISSTCGTGPGYQHQHSDIPLPHILIKGVNAIAIFDACAWSSSMDSSMIGCYTPPTVVAQVCFCFLWVPDSFATFLLPIPKNIEASQFNCSFGDYICDYTTNFWCKRQLKKLALPHWCSCSGCSNGGTKFRY